MDLFETVYSVTLELLTLAGEIRCLFYITHSLLDSICFHFSIDSAQSSAVLSIAVISKQHAGGEFSRVIENLWAGLTNSALASRMQHSL
jgi:hypothetical protein